MKRLAIPIFLLCLLVTSALGEQKPFSILYFSDTRSPLPVLG